MSTHHTRENLKSLTTVRQVQQEFGDLLPRPPHTINNKDHVSHTLFEDLRYVEILLNIIEEFTVHERSIEP